jgi:hypothetical protein
MTDRPPTTLPTPEADAALAAALRPLFDQSAATPSADALARLTTHAESLPGTRRALAPLQFVALAAVVLLAVLAGQWTPTLTQVTPAHQVAYDADLDDASWLDSDELGDGFDLLVLCTRTDDPEAALEAIDALIADLGDDA